MAKAFNEDEKALIKEKLKKGAIEYMERYGVRKASVDELVKYAGISKGAFYLFYESKELLFFDAVMEHHQQLQDYVSVSIQNVKGEVTPEVLTETIYNIIKENQSFWVALLTNLDYIMRKLPKEITEQHLLDDDKFFDGLLQTIQIKQNLSAEVFSGVFRAIFLTILHAEFIGEKVYDDVLRTLIKSVVHQIFYHQEN